MTKLTNIFFNLDKREEIIRKEVEEHLSDFGVADTNDYIVATYFIHTIESTDIEKSAQEIARLQTSGEKYSGNGTRLQKSTGYLLDSIPFNSEKIRDAEHRRTCSTRYLIFQNMVLLLREKTHLLHSLPG